MLLKRATETVWRSQAAIINARTIMTGFDSTRTNGEELNVVNLSASWRLSDSGTRQFLMTNLPRLGTKI